MTTNETQTTDAGCNDYFGVCPVCGKEPEFRNVDRSHWAYCKADGVKWLIGSNLFSSWRGETKVDWAKNAKFLGNFTEVQPGFPDSEKTKAGCAVCDPENDPPMSDDDILAERRAFVEGRLKICRDGWTNGWAVTAKSQFWGVEADDGLVIVITGLASEKAAEAARDAAIKGCCNDPRYIDPYAFFDRDDPVKEFNAIGRIFEVLEEAWSIADLSTPDWAFVARRAYQAAMDLQEPLPNRRSGIDDECPF